MVFFLTSGCFCIFFKKNFFVASPSFPPVGSTDRTRRNNTEVLFVDVKLNLQKKPS